MSIKRHVALVIWKLTNTNSHCFMKKQSSMGWTMAMTAMHEVYNAIFKELGPSFIRLGNPQEAIAGFKQMGFLNCMEATDGK